MDVVYKPPLGVRSLVSPAYSAAVALLGEEHISLFQREAVRVFEVTCFALCRNTLWMFGAVSNHFRRVALPYLRKVTLPPSTIASGFTLLAFDV